MIYILAVIDKYLTLWFILEPYLAIMEREVNDKKIYGNNILE